ncbi:MAG TPA: hypothetical protein VGA55_01890 [Bacteroidota bacterium]
MAPVIVVLVIVMLVLAIVLMVREKNRSSGIALTAFQDLQVKDKQRAIEVIMGQKEQKKLKEEEAGQLQPPTSSGAKYESQ